MRGKRCPGGRRDQCWDPQTPLRSGQGWNKPQSQSSAAPTTLLLHSRDRGAQVNCSPDNALNPPCKSWAHFPSIPTCRRTSSLRKIPCKNLLGMAPKQDFHWQSTIPARPVASEQFHLPQLCHRPSLSPLPSPKPHQGSQKSSACFWSSCRVHSLHSASLPDGDKQFP